MAIKKLTAKMLFTIRQLQPEYEMQRNPGSFFGQHSHAYLCSHAIYGASPNVESLNKKNP